MTSNSASLEFSKATRKHRTLFKGFTLSILVVLMSLVASTALGAIPQPDPEMPVNNIGTGSAAVQKAWTIETLEGSKYFTNMTDRSLRFDTSSYPRIAYGGDHLYYAWHDGIQWRQTTVDASDGVGQYASLALDRFNRPRITYHDSYAGTLKLAYVDISGNWVVKVLDGTGGICVTKKPGVVSKDAPHSDDEIAAQDNKEWRSKLLGPQQPEVEPFQGVGLFTSIAVDANNMIHISYYDAALKVLKYASWDGIKCVKQIVDGDTTGKGNYDVGLFTSIAVDARNNPGISYFDEKYDHLKYAEMSSNGTWYAGTIDSNSLVGMYTSLFIRDNGEGHQGEGHISYYDYYNGDLKYAYRPNDESGWETYTADSGGDDAEDVGGFTSLARAADNYICISYYNFSYQDLEYVCNSDWIPYVVDSLDRVGQFTSQATDGNGISHVTYLNYDRGELIYATRANSKWSGQPVDTTGGTTGINTSIDLDPSNQPWISYYDQTNTALRYAYKSGGVWIKNPFASGPKVSNYSSMKLDSQGHPRVAYYDPVDKFLMYAYWSTSGWQFQRIDAPGDGTDVGRYVSLAIGANDMVHVSYYDATNGRLKYARLQSNGWYIMVVDPADANVGLYSSITVGPDGYPAIAYYDATHKRLKFAYNTPTDVWNIEVVDAKSTTGQEEQYGFYPSIAVTADGKSCISYYAKIFYGYSGVVKQQLLKYAVRTEGNVPPWSSIVVDGNDDGRDYLYNYQSSLALDSKGYPWISYYVATTGDLHLLVWNGYNFVNTTIDSLGDVGLYNSLVLTADGDPRISYHSATTGGLKYAEGLKVPLFFINVPSLVR